MDALGFARPNKLHKPRIWDVDIKRLHKQCSLICLENNGTQVMLTSMSGTINLMYTYHPSTTISTYNGRLIKNIFATYKAKMELQLIYELKSLVGDSVQP